MIPENYSSKFYMSMRLNDPLQKDNSFQMKGSELAKVRRPLFGVTVSLIK